MKQMATCLTDRQEAITLGSVVAFDGEYGVVWHAARDVMRVLQFTRGTTAVRVSLANEVALHLPVSLGGWSIAYDDLIAWPRGECRVVGEIDERCLLRFLKPVAPRRCRVFRRVSSGSSLRGLSEARATDRRQTAGGQSPLVAGIFPVSTNVW